MFRIPTSCDAAFKAVLSHISDQWLRELSARVEAWQVSSTCHQQIIVAVHECLSGAVHQVLNESVINQDVVMAFDESDIACRSLAVTMYWTPFISSHATKHTHHSCPAGEPSVAARASGAWGAISQPRVPQPGWAAGFRDHIPSKSPGAGLPAAEAAPSGTGGSRPRVKPAGKRWAGVWRTRGGRVFYFSGA